MSQPAAEQLFRTTGTTLFRDSRSTRTTSNLSAWQKLALEVTCEHSATSQPAAERLFRTTGTTLFRDNRNTRATSNLSTWQKAISR